MIIYFIENEKIYTYKLPNVPSGNYILHDYDQNGNKRSLINVEGTEGKWIIKDNDDTTLYYQGEIYKELQLNPYYFYQMVAYGTDNIVVYVAPGYDNTFRCYQMVEDTKIVVGNTNYDVNYSFLSEKVMEITLKDNIFSFKSLTSNVNIYVNKNRMTEGKLNNFDEIFCNGIRFIFLGNKIYMNNPDQNLMIISNNLVNPTYTLATENFTPQTELFRDFYDAKDYYYKSQVFLKGIEEVNLTISNPPQKQVNRKDPLLMTLIPSLLMGSTSVIMGYFAFINMGKSDSDWQSNIMTIIMAITMLIASIVWPFIERFYERFVDFNIEQTRKRRYKKYLIEKENILKEKQNDQKVALIENYISLKECQETILKKTPNLFSRNWDNNAFLEIRLGVGDVALFGEIIHEKQEYKEVDDKLLDMADKLISKYDHIPDAPFHLSLYEKKNIVFISSEKSLLWQYIESIILQLITYHSYYNLKIVILTNKGNDNALQLLKDSPFCFSDDKKIRYYAEEFDEGQLISDSLIEIFNYRSKMENKNEEERNQKNFPYYLIISDNINNYHNLRIISEVLEEKRECGFSIVAFDTKISNVPDGFKNFVSFDEKEGHFFTSDMKDEKLRSFKPEFPQDINITTCISAVSNIPILKQTTDSSNLPDTLGFLEMYGVGKIEQLNIENRWKTSNIYQSLQAPIGVDANGNILSLDLHEMKHGPHGLIAGMTGSGKSEFIISYVLSLAINYSPKEVQFVLIDYKGGGLAGAFENRKANKKLPHLVGTITNLDKSEMNRTLVSINSELHRRQRIFNEAKERLNTGTIDIYKYQQLVREEKLEEPLSHLFIICDEFAELKQQQPDFMEELISTARIGRSLGVHLILATQKPSGVVDDQIWSNSKFKICCKVQTTEDSTEMINKPDAAFIKEVGRFYLQVGYDEYFTQGQSAYSGVNYITSDKIKSTVSTDIEIINNYGEIIKSIKEEKEEETQESKGEELINILDYLIEVAKKEGYENSQLWLDSIPEEIIYNNVKNAYNIETKPYDIKPLIGMFDDPANQRQGPIILDMVENGNTFISGIAGSGKSTFITTMLYSIVTNHSPQESNIIIVDLLTETLTKFLNFPQVSEVITRSDNSKINKLFYFLQNQVEKRKRYYALNGGNFEFEKSTGKTTFPTYIVVINGIEVLKEGYEDLVTNVFASLAREVNYYGIYFYVTGTNSNALGFSLENSFSTKIAMRLTDTSEYSSLFGMGCPIPKANPGRGIMAIEGKPYEFQVAEVSKIEDLDQVMKATKLTLNQTYAEKAPSLPTIPTYVNISSLRNEQISLASLPIGFEERSACLMYYDFSDFINIITYGNIKSALSFSGALVTLFQYLNNTKNFVISSNKDYVINNIKENTKVYTNNYINIIKVLNTNFNKLREEPNDNMYIVTIFDYNNLQVFLKNKQKEDSSIVTLDDLIVNTKDLKNIRYIIVDGTSHMRTFDNYSWYNLVQQNKGILVSKNIDDQELFKTEEMDISSQTINRDEAVVFVNNTESTIKFINM